jgi:ketosteroid isomerase-like protein
MDPIDAVRAWTAALNARDADAAVAAAHPDIVLHGPRGLERGHDAVRDWIHRQTYGVGMLLQHTRAYARGPVVVVESRVELRHVDDGELADVMTAAAVMTVADAKVKDIAPVPDLATALASAGLSEADEIAA